MHILLISTYDLGRQPFALASPAAWLRAAGFQVATADLSRERLDPDLVGAARLIAFSLPMHTATRLALPVIMRVREIHPAAHLCCYGIYAPPNAQLLRERGVATILAGEFEEDLVRLASKLARSDDEADAGVRQGDPLPRLRFLVPERTGLPPLERYASLELGDGRRRIVGYTEASRGCKHLCRHCPIVPVYQGRFRVIPPDVVLADIRGQVERGADHITFGDPDFFNGIGHALKVVSGLAREFPRLTYDVTIKIEHLLRHADQLARLRDTGCLFVTSAAESVDDYVLERLRKGHTRADFVRVVELCRQAGLTLSPTFVPFTPWTSIEGYCDLLETIDELDLIDHVAPIQLAIRLLLPEGSLLLHEHDVRALAGPFQPETLTYPWTHPDHRMDDLHRQVSHVVGRRALASRRAVFHEIVALAHERAGRVWRGRQVSDAAPDRAAIPYLNEPWYC